MIVMRYIKLLALQKRTFRFGIWDLGLRICNVLKIQSAHPIPKSQIAGVTSSAFLHFLLLISLTALTVPIKAQQSIEFPPSQKIPVTNEYHGIKVVDNYRWLENANAPAVKQWVEE